MGARSTILQITLCCVLLLSLLLTFHLAHAAGGLVSEAYWTIAVDGYLTALAVADLDHDGWGEILGGTDEGKVIVWTADGQKLWEFEVETDWVTGLSSSDLDGDGQDEVLITAAGILPTHYLYVLRHNGSLWWSHTVRDELWSALPINLDDDAYLELLLAAQRPLALDTDGVELTNWPVDLLRTPHISLVDWDGDGTEEIVTVTPEALNLVEADGSSKSISLSILDKINFIEIGDADGDGAMELVILTDAAVMLLGMDGSVRWTRPLQGEPGELMLIGASPDQQGQKWIIFSESNGVIALNGSGQKLWGFDAGLPATQPFTLTQSNQWFMTGTVGGQAYMLDADGQRMGEYDLGKQISLAQITDLNGDGYQEVLLATEGSLSLFGGFVGDSEIYARWMFKAQAPVVALGTSDVDEDGRDEILIGERNGRVTLRDRNGSLRWQQNLWDQLGGMAPDDMGGFLIWTSTTIRRYAGSGELWWEVEFPVTIRTAIPSAGGVAVLTDDGKIPLLSLTDGRLLSTIRLESPIRDFAPFGTDIVLITENRSVVLLGQSGGERWRTKLDRPADEIVSVRDNFVVVRSRDHLVWLDGEGSISWDWSVQPAERITGVDLGEQLLVVGTDSRLIALDRRGFEVWSILSDDVISAVATLDIEANGTEEIAVGTVKGTIALLSASGEQIWETKGRERVNVLITSDLNGDGLPEILGGFEDGLLIAYGMARSQPPWLGAPIVTSVGDGYQYAVRVNDPEGDPATISLEIWDPSAKVWILQGSLEAPTGEGTLTWNVPNPFDTWDAGKDSAFRFTWDNAQNTGTTAASPGPLEIPVDPWYLTYGRTAILTVLILAIPVLLLVTVRRSRAYRRSPLGQAEMALLRLTLDPEETLVELHRLLSNEVQALTLLDHMPALARDSNKQALSGLLEGAHLALTRPEVMVEALRTFTDSLRHLPELPFADETLQIYTCFLEAISVTSVSEVVRLRGLLGEVNVLRGGTAAHLMPTTEVLDRLGGVSRTLRALEHTEASRDRIGYLAEAAADLGHIERYANSAITGLELHVTAAVIHHWLGLVTETLEQLRGRAEIDLTLHTRQLVVRENVTLAFSLTNNGRSPATDIVIEIVPNDELSPISKPATIDVLTPGARIRLESAVQPLGSIGSFEITFQVMWDDREAANKQAHFTERIRLVPAPQDFLPIPNPYATGRPLSLGSPVFVGREDIFEFVKEKLFDRHIVVLIGERRMGKTSLLRQLPSRLGEMWSVAYLDAQGLGLEGGLTQWLEDAATEISHATGYQPSLSADDLASKSGSVFETFLQRVVENLPEGRRLLVLLDEFEEIETRVRNEHLPSTIFPYLRHLMQFGDLSFLLACTQRLERLSPEYWTPLFNIGLYREIGPLQDAAARRLITRPVEGRLLFDDLAVDKMLRLSGNQPYFLQLLCHCVVARCNRERIAYMTAAEVDVAAEEAIMLGHAHLNFLWERASEKGQRALTVLAKLIVDGVPGTPDSIIAKLTTPDITTEELRQLEILKSLVDLGLVNRTVDGQYRFMVDLFRLWVERRGIFKPNDMT